MPGLHAVSDVNLCNGDPLRHVTEHAMRVSLSRLLWAFVAIRPPGPVCCECVWDVHDLRGHASWVALSTPYMSIKEDRPDLA